jgi:hypothetical protein
MVTDGEVRPADIVPVIAPSRSQAPTVFPMVWGFHLPQDHDHRLSFRHIVPDADELPCLRTGLLQDTES